MQHLIVCAAIRDATGQVVSGVRHFDGVMHATIKSMMSYTTPWEQGFLDNAGRFLSREEAYLVAEAAGQIRRRVGGDNGRLFSENLY